MNETVQNIFEKAKTTAVAAGKVTGQALDNIGKKMGEQIEIIKTDKQISDSTKEIDDLYQQIGRLVYSVHLNPDGDTEEIDALLPQLDEKHTQAQALQARLDEAKQLKTCPQCDQKLQQQDSFCRYCGKAV